MCWFCFQNDTFFETLLKLRRKLLFLGLDCSFGNLGLTSHTALFSSDTLIFYKHHPFFCTDEDTKFFNKNASYNNDTFFYKNVIFFAVFRPRIRFRQQPPQEHTFGFALIWKPFNIFLSNKKQNLDYYLKI